MKKIKLPYLASEDERLETLFKLVKFKKGNKFVDLGCGDGRVVIRVAQKGLFAYGFEILEKYARRSKFNVVQAHLEDRAFIYQTDFWKESLSEFDYIFIFGMRDLMERLDKKLRQEAKPGAVIISNGFPLPSWREERYEDHIYIYKKF